MNRWRCHGNQKNHKDLSASGVITVLTIAGRQRLEPGACHAADIQGELVPLLEVGGVELRKNLTKKSVNLNLHLNFTDMIARHLSSHILELLSFYPAVGLVGPRQVGKTTLARSLEEEVGKPFRYFDLERLEDFRRLESDPGFFLEQYQDECVIIDEVQRLPALFTELRSLIDRKRVPGRFLLLGSASPLLLRNTSESLAGRIAYVTLQPFHQGEVVSEPVQMRDHWWRGGFPEAWLAPSDAVSFHWRENFLRTYVERDLQFLGLNTDPIRFRTFMQMLAGVHGNLWNAESLGRSLGLAGNTIRHYLHFLESSFMVRVLPPFHINLSKRLVKSPKVYIQDSGLLHTLLGIRSPGDLPVSHHAGASWEGYAISQILQVLPEGLTPYFYQTSDGTECDLVLTKGLTPYACIEIKLGNVVKAGKGFQNIIQTLGTHRNFIITYSSDPYALKESIEVRNLWEFVGDLNEALR
jgi:predicted AAA+ superfamily ATPase